jgi:hypothetical protein
MAKIPDGFPEIEILDNQGQPHKMAELWRDRAAVIHFVRHFG